MIRLSATRCFQILSLILVFSLTSLFPRHPDWTFERALLTQQRYAEGLMAQPGVVAVGVGWVNDSLGLHIYLDDPLHFPTLPSHLDGVPVETRLTGSFFLLDGGPAHQTVFPPPVPMGVQITNGVRSSSSTIDLGTLGFKACDASDSSIVGFVTNNHVAVAGGPSLCPNQAPIGTSLSQPLPVPRGASIGDLSRFVPINFAADNRVDGAFVQSSHALVSDRVLDIGWPTTRVRDTTDLLGRTVQKSGRTTGHTMGRVAAISALTNINLGSACGGPAQFVNQIIVEPAPPFSAFGASGDSGSAVWDADNNLVGLLFAGNGQGIAIVNRIDDVLAELNLRLDCPEPTANFTAFPQFANGFDGLLTSSLILLNPSSTDSVYGVGSILTPEGSPLNIGLNAEKAPGRFSFFLNPLSLTTFSTTDLPADPQVGSVRLNSNGRIEGSILFTQTGAGTAGVGAAPPATSFVAATFRNVDEGTNSGVAIQNVGSNPVTVAFSLRAANGAPVPNGEGTLTLAGNGQRALYIDELFPNADTRRFTGTLRANSPTPIAAVTVMGPNALTTLPVANAGSFSQQALFPQFAVGQRGLFSSSLILFNPSSVDSLTGTISFVDSLGATMVVEIDGSPVSGSRTLTLPPLGVQVLKTTGQSEAYQVGSVRVQASGPISGSVLFSWAGVGIAGVGNSQPLRAFLAPVFRDVEANNKNTGIALTNTQSSLASVELTLRDARGVVVFGGSRTVELTSNGQLAQFIDQLFPQAATAQFAGTLSASSSVSIAATVLALDNRSITTLPVVVQDPPP